MNSSLHIFFITIQSIACIIYRRSLNIPQVLILLVLLSSYSLNVLFNLVRCIFAVYLLTLGLQRLSYGFSKDNNIMLVFTLLLTHIVEGFLWWSMALTKSSLTPIVLLLDAIQLKLGVDTFIVLIGVPLLVTLMMYLSIDSFIKKKNI